MRHEVGRDEALSAALLIFAQLFVVLPAEKHSSFRSLAFLVLILSRVCWIETNPLLRLEIAKGFLEEVEVRLEHDEVSVWGLTDKLIFFQGESAILLLGTLD